jgi:hypothetical protein
MQDRVLALSEFGITSLEWPDRVLTGHSSVEGLSGVGLSGLAASPDGSFALLGYRDGRIDRWTPDDVRTLDDIPRSGQFQGRTEVLEFAFASADRVFAATAFGVVELDLSLNAVRGTYRMRTNSDPTYVTSVAVLGDSIFAATELGLRAASLQDPLYLPSVWQARGRFADSVLTSLAASHGELAAVSAGKAYRRTAGGWSALATPQTVKKLSASAPVPTAGALCDRLTCRSSTPGARCSRCCRAAFRAIPGSHPATSPADLTVKTANRFGGWPTRPAD